MRRSTAVLASLLIAGLLPHAANADTIDARLQDLDRYLLLYSATGDERFLDRFYDLGADFEKSLTSQKNAAALKDVWQRYREALEKVRAAYSQSGVDLKQALAQSREVSELLDSIIVAEEPTQSTPTLADNLRELALLEAHHANSQTLHGVHVDHSEQMEQLLQRIDQQLSSLPANATRDNLRVRWTYLCKALRPEHTLLYAFNAQIEYLLAHLPGS